MAEAAQACVEASTELYKLIAASKLFKPPELRLLGVKRRDFEHGIKMYSEKAEEQYVRYISYDWDLMDLIERRKQKGLEDYNEYMQKMDGNNLEENPSPEPLKMDKNRLENIDKIILMFGNNLNHLFKGLLERFPKNLKHWAWYLKFCKKMKMHQASFDLCERLVKIHGDKPLAFSFAAEWTLMRKHNYEMSRTYILQGLRSHKDSHDLYLDLLWNELEYAAMLREKFAAVQPAEQDDLRDDLMKGQVAKMVYEDAKNTLGISTKTVPLFKKMLEIMKKFDFTKQFQEEIISEVLTKFPTCELFQDLVAKAHLVTKLDPSRNSTPYPMAEIERCYNTYRSMESTCATEAMWSLRLDFVEDMMKQTRNPHEGNQIKQWYLATAHEAHRRDKLSVNQYITWMNILREDDQVEFLTSIQNHVLSTAKPRLCKSADIWLCVFKCKISMQEEDRQIFELFKEGVRVLEKNSLPLFLTALTHFMPRDKDITRHIFGIGIGQEFSAYPKICGTLRVKYLEWLVLTYNRDKGREFYNSVCDLKPHSRDLHQLMYKLEWSGGEVTHADKKRMVKILDRATTQLGRDNVDVWIDRIRHDILYASSANKDRIVTHARNYLKDSVELLKQLDTKVLEMTPVEGDDEE